MHAKRRPSLDAELVAILDKSKAVQVAVDIVPQLSCCPQKANLECGREFQRNRNLLELGWHNSPLADPIIEAVIGRERGQEGVMCSSGRPEGEIASDNCSYGPSGVSNATIYKPTMVASVNQIYPANDQSRSQSEKFRAAHQLSLGADSYAGRASDDYQPPFGGCVPMWRAALGTLCIVGGFFLLVRGISRASLCGGIALVLGSSGVWLVEQDKCDEAQKDIRHKWFQGGNSVTQKYLTRLYYCNTLIGMANVLPVDKQIAVIGALAEGSSIRSIERLTGIHRDTIMRLGVRVGKGCELLLDSKMQDLSCNYLQMDEVWGFIGKKEPHCSVDDSPEFGDVWTYCAIDSETRLVPAFKCGKRNLATTTEFVHDVASRMRNRVQISTDALRGYAEAIEQSFGSEVDYG